MKAGKRTWGILIAGLVLAGIVGLGRIQAEEEAATLRETVGEGYIDWTKGMVYARGEAALNTKEPSRALARVQAERAATVIAQRNLLEIVKGVRVESETTVETFVLKSDRIRARVTGVVRGAGPVKVEEDPSGLSVRVTVAAPLWGELSKSLLDEILPASSRGFLESLARTARLGLEKIYRTVVAWAGVSRVLAAPSPHTGLVIDVSDTEIKPGLFPKIYDQEGHLIIGPDAENKALAANIGLVGYAPSIAVATKDDLKRVGVLPLVSRGAVPVGQRAGIDITVKDLTLNKIKSALGDPSILKECKITVAYKVTF